MGTWCLGEGRNPREQEFEALRAGLDAGVRLIDTAEMYGEGLAEELVGDALRGYDRSQVFLVSKVYPHNAGRPEIFQSLDASLRRLNTDYLDLYLLHWRGSVPLRETVECMEELVEAGKILGWGVSNFDIDDMEELWDVPKGDHCLVNQDLYHLGSRGVEYALLPWMRRHGVPLMAYCPLAQAGSLRRGLVQNKAVDEVARRHGVTAMQVLLAFVLSTPGTIAIPRSSRADHVRQNVATASLELTSDDLALLNRAFPAPTHKLPLDME